MLQTRRTQDIMPYLFNELLDWNNFNHFDRWGRANESMQMPKMNISESETDFQLELCVPGLKKEDLQLTIDAENNLVVEMDRKEESTNKDESRHYIRKEFGRTQFKQMLALPENIKKDQITASVENGILLIAIPKVTAEEKKALAQTIEIK